MSNITRRRVEQLEAMGTIILAADDEELNCKWRDRLRGEDLKIIAGEDWRYHEVCDAFAELLSFCDFTV